MADKVLRVVCGKCKVVYRVKAGVKPGSKVRCRRCQGLLSVPHPPDEQPAAPVSAGRALLAGSDDDRRVSLADAGDQTTPARHGEGGDQTTPMRHGEGGDASEESVESFLRSCGSTSGRYVEQGIVGKGAMGEIVLCVDRNTRRPRRPPRPHPSGQAQPGMRLLRLQALPGSLHPPWVRWTDHAPARVSPLQEAD